MKELRGRDLEIELAHLQRLASIHRDNIYTLREQRAQYGIGVPIELESELSHQEEELAHCEERIKTLRQELAQRFPPELGEILEFAKDIAKAGANVAGKYYRSSEENDILSEEGVKNLTTKADKEANDAIIQAIRSCYSKHHIIAEEGGDIEGYPNDKGFTWVVDAIDGTVNFFLKVPLFCTAIGILWNGEPCAGVIYDPIRKEMFFAQRGHPAYKEKPEEKLWGEEEWPKEIHTNFEEQLSRAVVLTHLSSRRHAREEFTSSGLLDAIANAVRSIRALGSGQLALAYVAQGQFHAFINNATFSWDQTAGLVIVESAGGVVTDFKGNGWSIESESIIAAANERIHDKLAAIVSALYPFEDPIAQQISVLLQSNPDLAKELLDDLLTKVYRSVRR